MARSLFPRQAMIQALVPKIFVATARYTLRFTLYEMMHSSHDFEDVKLALNNRTNWSIELFRSCFTIHLDNGSYFFMLCVLSFLVMAEGIHVHYGRLSPPELKECAENMGHLTFSLLFAVLDIGFIIVRVAGLVALSRSSGLAASLVLASMFPSIIFPLLNYGVKLVKRRRGSDKEAEVVIV